MVTMMETQKQQKTNKQLELDGLGPKFIPIHAVPLGESVWEYRMLIHDAGTKKRLCYEFVRGPFKGVVFGVTDNPDDITITKKDGSSFLNFEYDVLFNETKYDTIKENAKFDKYVGKIVLDVLERAAKRRLSEESENTRT